MFHPLPSVTDPKKVGELMHGGDARHTPASQGGGVMDRGMAVNWKPSSQEAMGTSSDLFP